MRILEKKDVEQPVVDWAEAHGIPALKMNVDGQRGWPDRQFLILGGRPLFMEFKVPGEKPDPIQGHRHETLSFLGYPIEVHDDKALAIRSLSKALDAGKRTAWGRKVLAEPRGRRAPGRPRGGKN